MLEQLEIPKVLDCGPEGNGVTSRPYPSALPHEPADVTHLNFAASARQSLTSPRSYGSMVWEHRTPHPTPFTPHPTSSTLNSVQCSLGLGGDSPDFY